MDEKNKKRIVHELSMWSLYCEVLLEKFHYQLITQDEYLRELEKLRDKLIMKIEKIILSEHKESK